MKKLLLLFIALPITALGQEEMAVNADEIFFTDEVSYFIKDSTLVTGKVREWHYNGQLKGERIYKDGKLDGVYKAWHYTGGRLSSEGIYKDGRKEGVWKIWNENGQLESENTYKDDRDVWKTWYENGQLRFEVTYKDGKKEGWKTWNEDGKLISEETYKDGKLISKKEY